MAQENVMETATHVQKPSFNLIFAVGFSLICKQMGRKIVCSICATIISIQPNYYSHINRLQIARVKTLISKILSYYLEFKMVGAILQNHNSYNQYVSCEKSTRRELNSFAPSRLVELNLFVMSIRSFCKSTTALHFSCRRKALSFYDQPSL